MKKSLYNEQEISDIVNESVGILFPQKKSGAIQFKKKETYNEDVNNKLVALECGLDAVQGMIANNPNIVAGNFSQFDAVLDKIYSLIREVEMLKQNSKNF